MNRLHARELLNLSTEALWALPEERHIVVFDDGEVVTHTRATITSVYLWYPILAYPEAPILQTYHLQETRFTSRVMLRLLNRIIWGIHGHYREEPDPEELARHAFRTVNRFYNDFTIHLSAYVATLSMFDVMEVMEHPTIAEANRKVQPTEHSIEKECYPAIRATLLDPHALRGNPLTEAVKAGTLKMDQMLQCVGPRGYMTDIDSTIFPEPILKGYVEGIDGPYESLIESRSGTKSLLYNKELLRDTEYFNRKTQLVAQYVRNLHPGDCGTPHLIDFPVTEHILPHLTGKYYQDGEAGLKVFQGNETYLYGKTVRLRSLFGCLHPDPAGVCSVCYGRLAFSIPRQTNIGQVSAVQVGDKITSSVLSTKHLDSTSKVEKIILGSIEKRYLRYGKQAEALYLQRNLKGRPIRLTVHAEEVSGVADVMLRDRNGFKIQHLDDYPIGNASQLTNVHLTVDMGDEGQEQEELKVSLYNRKASFSKELLEYIRRVGWDIDSQENFVIELSDYDVEAPLFQLPFKHVSMHEVMQHIRYFLHSGGDDSKKRLGDPKTRKRIKRNYLKSYKDPVEALIMFSAMLNEKLDVNLVHCEVLLYAMMVRSSLHRDYRLPIPGIDGVFETYNNIMQNRSKSATMAFEKQHQPLNTPSSFLNAEVNDHPYDALLLGGQMS